MTEKILSIAVVLTQNGHLRNEVFLGNKSIYIANFDNTVILHFDSKEEFPEKIGMESNQYDSPDFKLIDGKIVFTQNAAGFVRKKSCATSKRTFDEIDDSFRKLYKKKGDNRLDLHTEVLSLLEESLSHIEVSAKNRKPLLLQRDIYSGSTVELTQVKEGFGVSWGKTIKEDFGPIGLRTADLLALFTFSNTVKFFFGKKNDFAVIEGDKFGMKGIVAGCLYDEGCFLESIQEEENGREIEEIGRGVEEADSTADSREGEERKETVKRQKGTGFLRR